MDDLMQFNSPNPRGILRQVHRNSQSPGTNPFDDLERVVNAAPKTPKSAKKSMFHFNNSFEFLLPGHQLERESLDFGRESLGILNFETMNLDDQSLAFLRPPSKATMNKCLNFGPDSPAAFLGRESITLSNLKTSSVPRLVLWECEKVSLSDQLNVAFLGNSNATSNSSTSSSVSPSFNFASFQSCEPSKIYSVASECGLNASASECGLNASFSNTGQFLKQLQVALPKKDEGPRRRTRSAPQLVLTEKSSKFVETTEELKFWSGEKPKEKLEGRLDDSFSECEDENSFNDFVAIEANHFALRLANGSLLNESFTDVLDCTPQPEELLNVLEDDSPPAKCDTETVFKTVDRMLPPPAHQQSACDPQTLFPPKPAAGLALNKSESLEKRRVFPTQETIQMLHNLSGILTNENPSAKDKCEGETLLNSLSTILQDRVTGPNLDDSGHSSIEPDLETDQEKHECFEILDLRTPKAENGVTNIMFDNCGALDLSMRSNSSEKEFVVPEMVKKKFDNTSKTSISSLNSTRSLTTLSQTESQLKISLSNKIIKQRRPEVRGPMKAVIPINSMTKRSLCNEKSPLASKKKNPVLKKTSTPISEPRPRPVAHSTPDDLPNNLRSGSWKHPPVSPLARTSLRASNGSENLNNLGSFNNNSSGSIAVPNGRHSFTESNRSQEPAKGHNGTRRSLGILPRPQLDSRGIPRIAGIKGSQAPRRSNSVEKGSSCDKIRENILKVSSNSRRGSLEKINVRDGGAKGGLGENRGRNPTTRTSLPGKVGKENAGR